MSEQKTNAIWGKVETLFIAYWPVLLGLVALYPDMFKNTVCFFHICCTKEEHFANYHIDFVIIITWLFIALWFYLHNKAEKKKETEQKKAAEENKEFQADLIKQHEELQETIRLAPNFKVFGHARSYFDTSIKLLENLNPVLHEIQTGYHGRIDEIPKTILAIFMPTLDLVSRFFNVEENTLGINIMFYMPKAKLIHHVDDILHSKKMFFVRKDHKNVLKGILYLDSSLYLCLCRKIEDGPLCVPIYASEAHVYNGPEYKDENISLSGAPDAFENAIAIIPDTSEREAFHRFDDQTQQELHEYFESKSSQTQSLISIKLPENLGVLNIESCEKNCFKKREEYISTFYTMVYPIISSSVPSLKEYRKNIISILTKNRF